ncbi:cytochrome P450 [Fimicolochytrium jonesii]|uniref:cytochrome P450 n=1 Tax=Fimicolochytrium jonesii TaxID=1396493 RepID=UPI0022FE7325|nr:cytochrome P450 [Fimicolochytrium jonesii]KAI8819825.1 cytochrome P450 [Fimicolochytrium jonesii]
MALALPATVAAGFLWGAYEHRNRAIGNQKPVSQLPLGPSFFPIIGNLIAILRTWAASNEAMHDMILEQIKKDPKSVKCVQFSIPFRPLMILTWDPRNVEHILKTNFDNFVKGEEFRHNMGDLLGAGIFVVDGEPWKKQRKMASHIFSVRNFRDFTANVFADESVKLGALLENAAQTGQTIDLQDAFFRFTLDSFVKLAFGINLGSLDSPLPVPFAAAFDRAQTFCDERFRLPGAAMIHALSGRGKQHAKDLDLIHEFARSIISRRRNGGSDSPELSQGNDLLALLLRITREGGDALSDDELADMVLNFIIAGRDTTAQALSWTFLLLTKNKHIEAEAVSEMKKFFGADRLADPNFETTYDEVKDWTYGKALFYETLRFYPSVPKDGKYAVKEDVLPDGTVVPAGALVMFSNWVMGRLEELHGSDAADFKPTRWIDPDTQAFKTPSQFQYPVFFAGPRVCLGQTMATIEGVYVIIQVLRRFSIEVQLPEKVTYTNSLTLPMSGPLRVHVSRRDL